MSNQLPISIQMGAMPAQVRWTPQQIADAIAARLRLVTGQSFALFVTGATAPTSDVGPWFTNGREVWVWNAGTGAYAPIAMAQVSLKYYIGVASPDPTKYLIWIETTAAGSPVALKTYYNGAWVDAYASLLTGYVTTAQLTTATSSYAAAAVNIAVPQTVPVDAAAIGHVIAFPTVDYNGAGAFDTATGRYTAPVAGLYFVTAELQVDDVDSTPAGMEMAIRIGRNGGLTNVIAGTAVATPPGLRWYPAVTGLVPMAAGDYITVLLSADDGVNTGDVTVANGTFGVYLVPGT